MAIIIFSTVSSVVMLLWNWLMPEIFGLTKIGFWQSAGLILLSKIIFSGFRKPGYGQRRGPWKNHWKEKWQNIPEDKREKWKQYFAEKWCGDVPEEKPTPEMEKKDDQ